MTLRDALLCVVFVAVVSLVAGVSTGQALRQGQTLPHAPNGPPRYYLREGSPQWICAPYRSPGETKASWSCVDVPTAIALLLHEPPDCGEPPSK